MATPSKASQSILDQIGESNFSGWMSKRGDRYNSWKQRYFVLKGPHLYWLKSNSKTETKIKGYVNVIGYKVVADENANPGRYGFKIIHETYKTHYFSSDQHPVIREWMKAIMKATIGRDLSKPVISSSNIPTIPLAVAQAMSPAPRPPSPMARYATQKALLRENPNKLSSRDARVLTGVPSRKLKESERRRLESFFSSKAAAEYNSNLNPMNKVVRMVSLLAPRSPIPTPPRPSRDKRVLDPLGQSSPVPSVPNAIETALIEWANSHLPNSNKITDTFGPICCGLALLRIAESICGKPSSPSVPDSAFPSDPSDDKLDGLLGLFDFLLDNDVKLGSVSINDVRQGKRDKIFQLLKALKTWEEKRRAVEPSPESPRITYVQPAQRPSPQTPSRTALSPHHSSNSTPRSNTTVGASTGAKDVQMAIPRRSSSARYSSASTNIAAGKSVYGATAESIFSFNSRTTMSACVGTMLTLRANPSPRSSLAS